jgi:NAD(P)-dependent dehydrogenase (short-subunit alcohol dehydrogenase family)
LNDLTPLRLEESAEMARALGAEVSTHVGDPSKGLFARGLMEEILDAWDRLDLLVTCPRAEPRLALIDLDEWDFQRTLEANVAGPFLLAQFFSRYLREAGQPGVILNLIGVGPHSPGIAGDEAFYTSQMALRALTVSAAPGFAALNIRIYGIACEEAQAGQAAGVALRLLDEQERIPNGTVIDLGEAR